MQIQLRRSNNKILAGVCAGIAEYFNVDPVIVRLLFVLSVLFAGFPIIIYPIMWLIMPAPEYTTTTTTTQIIHAIPDHPRPVNEWHYDPMTGERIRR